MITVPFSFNKRGKEVIIKTFKKGSVGLLPWRKHENELFIPCSSGACGASIFFSVPSYTGKRVNQ